MFPVFGSLALTQILRKVYTNSSQRKLRYFQFLKATDSLKFCANYAQNILRKILSAKFTQSLHKKLWMFPVFGSHLLTQTLRKLCAKRFAQSTLRKVYTNSSQRKLHYSRFLKATDSLKFCTNYAQSTLRTVLCAKFAQFLVR